MVAISPITNRKATRNYDLESILLRGNHESENSDINAAALEKSMDKEV